MQKLEIKKYKTRDFDYCMEIFELNCPKYFAESEREDCKKYLSSNQDHYLVGLFDKKVVAAFGIAELSEKIAAIRWIMINPSFQRKGYGKDLMKYIIKYSIDKKKDTITISTSQYAKSFFEKHGAVMISFEKNGWDEGLHKVNMKIDLKT